MLSKTKLPASVRPILIKELENLVAHFEASPSLLAPSQLKERFDLLDRIDAWVGNGDASEACATEPKVSRQLQALQLRLESLHRELFLAMRAEIQQGSRPALFSQLLSEESDPAGGLSFDYLDQLLAGVLRLEEPDPLPAHAPEGMVFYQPTPARHIVQLLRRTALTEADVLIDLGSGLGHVPLLASICAHVRAIGIEREAAYVACARRCAQQLELERVCFLQRDAREADLSSGTVFYLYTPFTGAILGEVLGQLQAQSKSRSIRICAFGPCTEAVAREPWLESRSKPDPDHITVFRSRR